MAAEPAFEQDARLMARVAAGDRRAQCELVARLSGKVRRVSRALLRNPADADDAAQAALLEILKSAGQYKGLGSIERWAERVVIRAAAVLVRRRRRAFDQVDFEADFEQVAEPPAEPSAAEDVVRPMSEYLGRLPEPIRMVLLLRHASGYSLEEISEMVESSPNAVKKRISRGRLAVRRMIRKDRVVGLRLEVKP